MAECKPINETLPLLSGLNTHHSPWKSQTSFATLVINANSKVTSIQHKVTNENLLTDKQLSISFIVKVNFFH